MRSRALITAALLAATPLAAQDSGGWLDRLFGTTGEAQDSGEDEGGFLEKLIEDNLSGEGRDVRITGFEGALGGRATIETMTFADSAGTWLTLSDVVLDWNRTALLRGRIEVAELSAASIDLPRLPLPAESTGPAPEASGFSLPELPVSVNIEALKVDRATLGAPVIGVETVASMTGGFGLAGGEGSASLAVERLNGVGSLTLDAAYSNATRVLAMNLALEEGPDGIVATLAGLPGRPALGFAITGEAPIDQFAADIRLSTDGTDRFAGRVTTSVPLDVPGASLRVVADLGGDIAPLFDPAYRGFFGTETHLTTRLTTYEDGRRSLDDLTILSSALTLTGEVALAPGGLPERIDLTGLIARADGTPVLLPLPGPETRIGKLDLAVAFDAEEGENWTGRFAIEGLDRPGFSAAALALDGTGRIRSDAPRSVTAAFDFDATALDLGDAATEAALGERVTGGMELNWIEGGPLRLAGLTIAGESYALDGAADVTFSEAGPRIDGSATVRSENLAAFSGLAGRRLGGAAELSSRFDVTPLAGFFDVTADGRTRDLVVSQPEADRILAGTADLALRAIRDEAGVSVSLNRLQSPNASISGTASLRTGDSSVNLKAELAEASLVLPGLAGPIRADFAATEADTVWEWRLDGGLDGTVLDAKGTAVDLFGTPVIAASGRLSVADLSDFATLARRPLAGALDTGFSGEIAADLSRMSLALDGTATDLVIGQPQADALLAGPVSLDIDISRAGGVIALRQSRIEGPQILLDAEGILAETTGKLTASGRIADASRLLDGAPPGPLSFGAETTRDGDDWQFDVSADGAALTLATSGTARDPMGPGAAIDGRVSASAPDLSVFSALARRPLGGSLNVDAEGRLSLDLADVDVSATANGSNVSVGIDAVDRLLAGALDATVAAARSGDTLTIDTLGLSTGLLTVSASGTLEPGTGGIDLDLRLADVGPFAPGFSGPLTVTGRVGQEGAETLTVAVSAVGPGGANARIDGTAARDVSNLDLRIRGDAPLGLANRFIEPRSIAGRVGFDLAVQGPPALESVSGRISGDGARLVAPTLNVALEDMTINASLANAQAQVSIAGRLATGGRAGLEGTLGLTGARNADLTIRLRNAVLTDPRLYETIVNGAITVNGPLAGGARIAGDLALGETTIRIPSSSIAGGGAIPEIVHIGEPAAVRTTRQRAGLVATAADRDAAAGPVYALDITVTAPDRVFVRGRGLEAEFGGELRITGTTENVIPVGAFTLIRGRLDILGKRLALDEAGITMQGSFIPVLRVVATTTADDVVVNVLVEGPATEPEIRFTSTPELPQEEVLSRLLFGRGLETLSAVQAARLALAVRTLSGKGGEGLLGKLRSGAGLADLDVTTDAEGNAQVSAGTYLGEDLYTDVTVGSDGETEINLNYDLTPSITLRGKASNTGETGIGIFFARDY